MCLVVVTDLSLMCRMPLPAYLPFHPYYCPLAALEDAVDNVPLYNELVSTVSEAVQNGLSGQDLLHLVRAVAVAPPFPSAPPAAAIARLYHML